MIAVTNANWTEEKAAGMDSGGLCSIWLPTLDIVRTFCRASLSETGRIHALKTDAPIWTSHDRAGKSGEGLTSHCFVKNLKKYAREAGVKDFHLHRTRHTFARIVSEVTGDITATQNALDHQNRSTTRVYVQRIAVKRDLYSSEISKRWGD